MTLLDWRPKPRTIGSEVRIIVEAETGRVPSDEECRDWVRKFIRRYSPSWQPGDEPAPEQARLIGSAFERMVSRARRQLRRRQ